MISKKNAIKESSGDYLKAIYELSLDQSPVSTSALANHLSVTNASASDMVRRMHREGYVEHTPYKGVSLTEVGLDIALSLLRRHRLWELFLLDTLQVPWADVHKYAELLEHATDDSLEDYLATFLCYPEKDPYGNPIPTKEGKITQLPRRRLPELLENQSAKILQFTNEDPELIEFLHGQGIQLGTLVTLKKRIPYDGSLLLLIDEDNKITLGNKIASTLIVDILLSSGLK